MRSGRTVRWAGQTQLRMRGNFRILLPTQNPMFSYLCEYK